MPRYNPAVIEPKWQKYWDDHKTFRAPSLPQGEKLYALDMFPYPSGHGLHVGHPEGYTATDIVSRAARMQGKAVMHPMGFDAFGLPAEEHAIKTGTHPRVQTEANIDNFRRQLKMLGFSYDWDRELATTDVKYFRWTQWIFLQVYDTWFDEESQRGRPIGELPIPQEVREQGEQAVEDFRNEHRLAYQTEAPVNWCPALGTVLANEEVIDGKSERGGHPVVRMPLRQWMLRITAYADRLEKDLEDLKWPESVKALQRNWIGRSTGAEVDFFVGEANGKPDKAAFARYTAQAEKAGFPRKPSQDVLRIYTTRPDTLFGATYMVIAPEHPYVERLTTADQRTQVERYCEQAASKSELDRTELAKEKTGVFSGSFAINPVNGAEVPIWIADYVLMSYGTGAIMAVPAHDERDFEFAQQFEIPVVAVVDPGEQIDTNERDAVLKGQGCFVGQGTAIHSGEFDGLTTADFKERITKWLETTGQGRAAVNYKLRDWLFSRQRFWGEPFPILHEVDETGDLTGRMTAVDESELPVDLPHLDDFKPHGRPEPPLGKAPEDWLYVERGGRRWKRETNTMPQWAGSCWYYLRFLDPDNEEVLVDPEIEKAWMPVDLYIGGVEHAVLHLLYARFWHKVLHDRGVVSSQEPFRKLVNQGMILGEAQYFKPASLEVEGDSDLEEVAAEDVELRGGKPFLKGTDTLLTARSEKMSKARGNVVNPDEIVRDFGADSLRLYEMFMGPLEATKPWSTDGVSGVRNFLGRAWRMIVDEESETMELHSAVTNDEPTDAQLRELHKAIQKVTSDIETLSFNTAIARMMEFTNFFTREAVRPQQVMESFVLLLAPFAPHIAEELWQVLGHEKTLAYEPWPQFDEALTRDEQIEIAVQIKGKVRGRLMAPADADRDALIQLAKQDSKVMEMLADKTIVKEIAVPGRLVNFVTR